MPVTSRHSAGADRKTTTDGESPMPIRGAAMILSLAALTIILFATSTPGMAVAQDVPRAGGVLKAAMIGEPPTIDTHTTTATIAYQVGWHMFESLYTYDKNYAPIP